MLRKIVSFALTYILPFSILYGWKDTNGNFFEPTHWMHIPLAPDLNIEVPK